MKIFLALLLLLTAFVSQSQLTDDFSDGDFTTAPTWNGTGSDFIVNAAGQLQMNNTVAASSYLSVPHGLSTLDGQEWRIWVKQSFAPSGSNYGRIYLTANSADLSANPDGFYLQLGEAGSQDAVRLFKSVSGISAEICAGPAAQIAGSFSIGIRVVRDNSGGWFLYIDPAGGFNYTLQASGTDPANIPGTYFGILGTYTSSNANKFYFDNVYAGPEIMDTLAPQLVGISAASGTEVNVLFDETVGGNALTSSGNYALSPTTGILSATIDGSNNALIHLSLSSSLQNGQTYQLTIASVEDLNGNSASNLSGNFTYMVNDIPEKGDLIISEFMCDPSPPIGLPEVEFVEIYNRSSKVFDLTGWKLGDASADGTITSGWILPGQYKLLCSTASLSFYPNGLAVTSFPSLNNTSDNIALKSPSLEVIDKLSYTDGWYNDPVKKEGGYTLELIHPDDPCSDASNWTASNHVSGGTPGEQNSVFDNTPDTEPPLLSGTLAFAPNAVELFFSEGMDSAVVAAAVVGTSPFLNVTDITVLSSFPTSVIVQFDEPIALSTVYTFTIGPVADCWLNTADLSGTFVLADDAMPGDLVINELLFDPGTGGSDFVEIFNRSSKIIDLKNFRLANFDNDTIANFKTIGEHYLLGPNGYIVLTPDSNFQKNQFPAAIPGTFYKMSLPALNNDSSTVYLISSNNMLIDKVSYLANWHLPLIDDTENKTLERIDPAGPSSYGGNWHTAAEPIGFGTPGGKNSHYQPGGINGNFGTLQSIFSPDNDGFEDVIQFYYTMTQPGMIATVTIFDDQGRAVRKLIKSELLGKEGNFTWDGMNDNGTKAGLGIYLAAIEAFSIDGTAEFAKRVAFTLAGKLD